MTREGTGVFLGVVVLGLGVGGLVHQQRCNRKNEGKQTTSSVCATTEKGLA